MEFMRALVVTYLLFTGLPYAISDNEYQGLGKQIAVKLINSKNILNVHYANKFAEIFNELIRLYPHLFHTEVTHTQLADRYTETLLSITNATLLDGYEATRAMMTQAPSAPNFKLSKSACPANCTVYGTCNEELRRCDCPRGRKGVACEERFRVDCKQYCVSWDKDTQECFHLRPEDCALRCNDRGICVSGYCHCFPGYFGGDCSLSLDTNGKPEILAGLNYSVNSNPAWPKVYIHELPPEYNTWRTLWLDRPLGMIIWERLLTGGHRVPDPAQADYFYIPAFVRSFCNDLRKFIYFDEHLNSSSLNHWLRRNNGSDHFITATGDWGRCEDPLSSRLPWLVPLIYLTHWGLKVPRSFPDRKFIPYFYAGCHRPERDVLMPPINHEVLGTWHFSPWYNPIQPPRPPKQRTTLASFAGGICGWMSAKDPPCEDATYSLDIRSKLYTLFHGKKDYVVEKKVDSLAEVMSSSKFCFGPPGHGWGRRAAMAVVLGCVPVVIQDDVDQAFEPNLNWTDFGLRIAEKDINFTDAILRNITDKHYEYMQSKLKCAAKHIFYTTAYGSLFGDDGFFDAFHTLLQLLMARKRNPEAPNDQLTQVDPAFRDFMACSKTLHDDEKEPLCAFTGDYGMKDSRYCFLSASGSARPERKYMAGGAVCNRVTDFAKCRRY